MPVHQFLHEIQFPFTSKSNCSDQNPEIRDILDKETLDRTDVDSTFRARFVSRWLSVTPSPARLENVPLLQGRDEGVYDFYKRVLARMQAVGAKNEIPSATSTGNARVNAFILSQHLEMFQPGLTR